MFCIISIFTFNMYRVVNYYEHSTILDQLNTRALLPNSTLCFSKYVTAIICCFALLRKGICRESSRCISCTNELIQG